jgi:3-methyl-2-oxobutanoate hydroxymethyltransferase
MPDTPRKNVTLSTLLKRVAAGEPIPVLTCYDATTARHLYRAGVDVLLVGDTAAEMVLGFDSTIHAPLEFMIQITAGVKRGAPGAFVMADMPFMSYQADEAEAIRNAGRFLTQGMADAVKLEVDGSFVKLVERMSRAGVPVVAHLGSRPQQVRRTGGYKAAGRTAAEAQELVDTARDMAAAGAVMLLIEATASDVVRQVMATVKVPVIGCGSGPACHGHVVVLQDLLGLTDWHPVFAEPVTDMGEAIRAAAGKWREMVVSRGYLKGQDPYGMDAAELEKFRKR